MICSMTLTGPWHQAPFFVPRMREGVSICSATFSLERHTSSFSPKLVFRSDGKEWKSLNLDLWMLLGCFQEVRIGEDCPHDPGQPFIVRVTGMFRRVSASIMAHSLRDEECTWISAPGSSIWQMVAIDLTRYLTKDPKCVFMVQGNLCLSCAWDIGVKHIQHIQTTTSPEDGSALAIICNGF